MTSKQRAFLRGQAQKLPAIFQIGKQGISKELIEGLTNSLKARELIKISVLETCEYNAKEAARLIAPEIAGCEVIQTIGSKIVLFVQNEKESKFDLKSIK